MTPAMIDEFAQRLCESRGRSWDHPYCKKNHWRALIAHPSQAMIDQMLEWVREDVGVACRTAKQNIDASLGVSEWSHGLFARFTKAFGPTFASRPDLRSRLDDRVSFDLHRDLHAKPEFVEPVMIGYDLGSPDGDTTTFARFDTAGHLHMLDEIREATGVSGSTLRLQREPYVNLSTVAILAKQQEAYNRLMGDYVVRIDEWRKQAFADMLLPPWRRRLVRFWRRARRWFA